MFEGKGKLYFSTARACHPNPNPILIERVQLQRHGGFVAVTLLLLAHLEFILEYLVFRTLPGFLMDLDSCVTSPVLVEWAVDQFHPLLYCCCFLLPVNIGEILIDSIDLFFRFSPLTLHM